MDELVNREAASRIELASGGGQRTPPPAHKPAKSGLRGPERPPHIRPRVPRGDILGQHETPPVAKVRTSLGMKHQPRHAARRREPFPEQHPGFGFGVASRDITAPRSRSNRTPSPYATFLDRPFGCRVPAPRELIEQLRRVSDGSLSARSNSTGCRRPYPSKTAILWEVGLRTDAAAA